MKTLLTAIVTILVSSPFVAMPAMQYMTYTSEVTFDFSDSDYNYGIGIGDILTHTYQIDKSESGYYLSGGTKYYRHDEYYSNGTIRTDYYFSDLVSGPMLENPDFIPNPLSDPKRNYYSADYYTNAGVLYRTMTWTGVDGGDAGSYAYHFSGDD